jgi:hypothetical protein
MPMSYSYALNLPLLAQLFFYGLLFTYSLYGIFLVYHWYTFGTSTNTSTIALVMYLLGGSVLFLTLSISIGYIQ